MKKILLLAVGVVVFLATEGLYASQPVRVIGSTSIGYDNNTGFNADRKGDTFHEETLYLGYTTPVVDRLKLKLSGSVLNVGYFNQTDYDFLIPIARVGFDFELTDKTTLETDYRFKYFYFPDYESVSSKVHEGRVGLHHAFDKNLYVEGGFTAASKNYDERSTRLSSGRFSEDEELEEMKNVVDAEIGYRFNRRTFVTLTAYGSLNDGNNQYNDYYDYEMFKVVPVVRLKLTQKCSAQFRFSYERREYDSRTLVDDGGTCEKDDIYTASAGLFYKYTKNLSIGLTYDYRQKNSNEPSQTYSGSTTSLGFYFVF